MGKVLLALRAAKKATVYANTDANSAAASSAQYCKQQQRQNAPIRALHQAVQGEQPPPPLTEQPDGGKQILRSGRIGS